MRSLSSASFRSVASQNSLDHEKGLVGVDPVKEKLLDDPETKGKLEFVKVDVDNNMV